MNKRLTRARTQLLFNNPFFGTLALKLKVVERPEVNTMATDGFHLFYNDEFVNSLPENELQGVYCHEVLHCALKHPWRRGEREPKKWNVAADYQINWLLVNKFRFTLPSNALMNNELANERSSSEEIYNKLPDMPEMPQWGLVMDAKDQENTSAAEQSSLWDIAIKQAVNAAKSAGHAVPDVFTELLNEARAKINWREQLRRLIGDFAKTDYSWSKTHPAYQDFVIPTLHKETLGHLTFAIDTSGSVHSQWLSQFVGELSDILDKIDFTTLTVLHADTDIRKIETFEPGDYIELKAYGRGGTYFKPVFDYIKEHKTNALIYFTDMHPCDGWPDAPDIPVFWVRTERKDAPFGEHIDIFYEDSK